MQARLWARQTLDSPGVSDDITLGLNAHVHKRLHNVNTDPNLTYVDLFAGCGGLSLGLEKAGFRGILAVEKSPMAAETYYHNFIQRLPVGDAGARHWKAYCEQPLRSQFEAGLIVDEVAALLREPALLEELRRRDVDLVAGGPPCQGFSMAGRRDPHDARNQLPWQFLDVVEAIEPKAVLIENVVGIGQDFVKNGAKAPFRELAEALASTGPRYVVQPMRLNAMHFGVPQHRPRMFLVGLRTDVARAAGLSGSLPFYVSGQLPPSPLCPVPSVNRPLTVRHALWDLVDVDGELQYAADCGDLLYMCSPGRYAWTMRCSPEWLPPALPEAAPPCRPLNATQRRHSPPIELRFRLYQYFDTVGIRSNVLNVAADPGLVGESRVEAVRHFLMNAPVPAIAPDGTVLAETKQELVALVVAAATKKHSQRPMRWDDPSPTVMSLPDDFVHPRYPRTFTVRELARLQSFPDNFEFRSKETTGSERRKFEVPQYTQVGNAVPPLLAASIGKVLAGIVSSNAGVVPHL
ncbi:MAG: hypothetical protein KatS3mg063_0196 [Tepidiforma sp.]|nr:MAG: hypothetical protein KatS3mg063_0196 [Tepidiforma sp.]